MLKANIKSTGKFHLFYLLNIWKFVPSLTYCLLQILIFSSQHGCKSTSKPSFSRPKDLNNANQIMTTSSLKSFSGSPMPHHLRVNSKIFDIYKPFHGLITASLSCLTSHFMLQQQWMPCGCSSLLCPSLYYLECLSVSSTSQKRSWLGKNLGSQCFPRTYSPKWGPFQNLKIFNNDTTVPSC